MKHLLKSFPEPFTIYVMGCWFKGTESTFGITDDYSSCDIIHLPTEDDKEHESFRLPNGNKMIDTWGGVYILTDTQLAIARQPMDDYDEAGLNQEGFVIENFKGDIYVDVINQDGISVLKPNPNMKEDLLYEILDGHEDDDGREIRIIFPMGSLIGIEVKECGKILGIEDYE